MKLFIIFTLLISPFSSFASCKELYEQESAIVKREHNKILIDKINLKSRYPNMEFSNLPTPTYDNPAETILNASDPKHIEVVLGLPMLEEESGLMFVKKLQAKNKKHCPGLTLEDVSANLKILMDQDELCSSTRTAGLLRVRNIFKSHIKNNKDSFKSCKKVADDSMREANLQKEDSIIATPESESNGAQGVK
jgi:hypothetical protein